LFVVQYLTVIIKIYHNCTLHYHKDWTGMQTYDTSNYTVDVCTAIITFDDYINVYVNV